MFWCRLTVQDLLLGVRGSSDLVTEVVDPGVDAAIFGLVSRGKSLVVSEPSYHIVSPGYEDPEYDEISAGNDAKGDNAVTGFGFDKNKAGDPDRPDNKEANYRTEETLSLAVVPLILGDETADDEELEKKEYIIAKERNEGVTSDYFCGFLFIEDKKHRRYRQLDARYEEHHHTLEVAVYMGGKYTADGKGEEKSSR